MEQRMQQPGPLTRKRLKTPRTAAIAGILFSVLLTTTMVLIRISVPTISPEIQDWSAIDVKTVTLALNLVPFAGIAFLWFIGVVRDRLGTYEDTYHLSLRTVGFYSHSVLPGGTSYQVRNVSGGLSYRF